MPARCDIHSSTNLVEDREDCVTNVVFKEWAEMAAEAVLKGENCLCDMGRSRYEISFEVYYLWLVVIKIFRSFLAVAFGANEVSSEAIQEWKSYCPPKVQVLVCGDKGGAL